MISDAEVTDETRLCAAFRRDCYPVDRRRAPPVCASVADCPLVPVPGVVPRPRPHGNFSSLNRRRSHLARRPKRALRRGAVAGASNGDSSSGFRSLKRPFRNPSPVQPLRQRTTTAGGQALPRAEVRTDAEPGERLRDRVLGRRRPPSGARRRWQPARGGVRADAVST